MLYLDAAGMIGAKTGEGEEMRDARFRSEYLVPYQQCCVL